MFLQLWVLICDLLSLLTHSSETAHRSSPWTVSTGPQDVRPATLELPFSLRSPQPSDLSPGWDSPTSYLLTSYHIKLPEAVYLKTMRGLDTHKTKSKSPRVLFPTSLHLARISLQLSLMPLTAIPTEAAFPEHMPTLCTSLISRLPHTEMSS